MGETTEQITTHIDQAREDLESNLEELEMRVRAAVDWRSHFRKRPGAMLIAAVLGGALLSLLIGKRPA